MNEKYVDRLYKQIMDEYYEKEGKKEEDTKKEEKIDENELEVIQPIKEEQEKAIEKGIRNDRMEVKKPSGNGFFSRYKRGEI